MHRRALSLDYTWKFLVSVYAIATLVYGICVQGHTLPFTLPFWGWAVLTLYFAFSFIQYVTNYEFVPLLFLKELSFTIANIVTALFCVHHSAAVTYVDIAYRVVNTAIMYLDIFIRGQHFRKWHLIGVFFFAAIFSIVSWLHYVQSGFYDPPLRIDWSTATSWIYLPVALGIIVSAFLLGDLVSSISCNMVSSVYRMVELCAC